MKLEITRVDVWIAKIKDRPGGLSEKMAILSRAGVNLEFMIARRAPEKPGNAVVFVTPIKGAKQAAAAKKAGFRKSKNLHAVRIAATDKPGLGTQVTQAIGEAGISMRGASGAAIGKKAIMHLAFDKSTDAAKAIQRLKKL
ncbi:MAG: hypothetical protein JXA82_03500 [Sedimentisphaerales bacterium]|nr:hypothetical protein [Sedimentisphaerales bacterium]